MEVHPVLDAPPAFPMQGAQGPRAVSTPAYGGIGPASSRPASTQPPSFLFQRGHRCCEAPGTPVHREKA
jgi:hypothetical protein